MESMKLAVASDFAGFSLKEAVKAHLVERGHEVVDLGQQTADQEMVYVDAAANLARAVQSGACERGIVMCGTGGGVSILANKFKGIYCVACESLFTAPKSAVLNHANVLAMGGRAIGPANACEMVDAWLDASFCGGFAPERACFVGGLFERLQAIEAENLK